MQDNVLIAAVLGAIQGVTEFLPVSSSAHLILTRDYFGWTFGSEEMNLLFDTVVNTGTMLALVLFFRRDLWRIFTALFTKERPQDKKLAIGILIGTIPAAIAGLLFDKQIEEIFRPRVHLILILLAVVGVLMWVADKLGKKNRDTESLGIWDLVLIGIAQALALMPGVSRSGATISTGLGLGLKREAAARISFLLSTPISVGVAVWAIKKALKIHMPSEMVVPMLTGLVVSAVVGIASIAFLLRFLRERTLLVFTVYRVALAAFLWVALSK